MLYNYADTRLEEKREVLAIVNFDGKVKWRPSSIFKSTCQINIQSFPYDHQNCLMKFGKIKNTKFLLLLIYNLIWLIKVVGPMMVNRLTYNSWTNRKLTGIYIYRQMNGKFYLVMVDAMKKNTNAAKRSIRICMKRF